MHRFLTTTALALARFITSPAVADTITVCASGCDHTSINDAIDAASDGDVIQLSAETYFEGDVIDTDGKAITLLGATDKGGNPTSILDGGNPEGGTSGGRLLICQSGETSTTVFQNLVIQNGYAAYGGGNYGAGMHIKSSSPTLNNCTFRGNSSVNGAGMHNRDGSSPTLTDCVFTGNSAEFGGGGMLNTERSNPTLTNCKFTGNSAEYGGGMYNWNCNPALSTCTFTGNSADNGAGIYIVASSNIPILTDSTVCENTSGGVATDDNQIEGDVDDSSSGNCIAADCTDCDGTCIGDLNDDGVVGAADIGLLFAVWGSDDSAADFDGDGTVNAFDLAYVLGYWGLCP